MDRRMLILTAAAENTELREAFPTAISGHDNDPRRASGAGRKRRGLTPERTRVAWEPSCAPRIPSSRIRPFPLRGQSVHRAAASYALCLEL
jgi:hypothetical protein